jgi:hypothetical protein
MNREKRMERREKNRLDRREVSTLSRRTIAEAIQHDDYGTALAQLFEIVTGDPPATYPPQRRVRGEVSLTAGAADALPAGAVVVVDVAVGGESASPTLSVDGTGVYTTPRLEDGEYPVSAAVESVYVSDTETLSRTEYEVVSSSTDVTSSMVRVDSTAVAIGEPVAGPTVTVDSVEIGGEL